MRCCGPLRVHGDAIEHARLADGEVGDVDHFLHFAQAFGEDLAVLERDQRAEIVLVTAQLLAQQPHGSPRFGAGTSRQAAAAANRRLTTCS